MGAKFGIAAQLSDRPRSSVLIYVHWGPLIVASAYRMAVRAAVAPEGKGFPATDIEWGKRLRMTHLAVETRASRRTDAASKHLIRSRSFSDGFLRRAEVFSHTLGGQTSPIPHTVILPVPIFPPERVLCYQISIQLELGWLPLTIQPQSILVKTTAGQRRALPRALALSILKSMREETERTIASLEDRSKGLKSVRCQC